MLLHPDLAHGLGGDVLGTQVHHVPLPGPGPHHRRPVPVHLAGQRGRPSPVGRARALYELQRHQHRGGTGGIRHRHLHIASPGQPRGPQSIRRQQQPRQGRPQRARGPQPLPQRPGRYGTVCGEHRRGYRRQRLLPAHRRRQHQDTPLDNLHGAGPARDGLQPAHQTDS